MRFKVDENLPVEAAQRLSEGGHDAITVLAQRLKGNPDLSIAKICASEQRALLTLDLDFADIRTYPPDQYAGIVVLRLRNQDRDNVLAVIGLLLPVLEIEPLQKRLWIVDEHSLRIRGED